jgi:predicted HicB family RNase H-like nuclease
VDNVGLLTTIRILWYTRIMAEITNLNIRNFSAELLRKVKSTAALQGKTLREWVIEAIQEKMRREK